MGLNSYFRSAQEKLMPAYTKEKNFHVVNIPMSDYQFAIYEEARHQERIVESNNAKRQKKAGGDGLYEESNKSYYIGYAPERALRTNIAYILHQADMMATHIEYDEWKRGDHEAVIVKKQETEKKTEQSKAANQAFKDLFGD